MSRRGMAAIVGGVAVVAVVAAAVGGYALVAGRGGTPTAALAAPRYVEEAAAAGIDHVYDGDFRFSVGGGVAAFDCSGDGAPELYVAGGSRPAALYLNESPVGGALRFRAVDDPTVTLADVEGAYPLDIDGDGLVDLAVLRAGESVVLRGLGDCRFERANEAWSFDGGHALATAFSATWEASASLPTLAVGNYLDIDAAGEPTDECAENALYRPMSGGSGYAPPHVLTPGYCALSMLFSDWDRSGRRDLRVSNDRYYYDFVNGQEQLWRMTPGEDPRQYTDADGWVQMQIEGMGIASHDLTDDGYPEVYLTSQGPNNLQTLASGPSQPTYRDIGLARGVSAPEPFTGGDPLPSTAWHAQFDDVNNDGFVDLFVTKGNIDEQPDYAMKDPSNLLLGRPDGTFVEGAEAAGVLNFARGRGGALTDLNLDGLLDLVLVNYRDRLMVWRNVGTGDAVTPGDMGHWVALRPVQPSPNRDAIGAWIEVKVGDVTIRREMVVGGGHLGGQLGWAHFGLGPATEAQVRVLWPDGEAGPWQRVAADGFAYLERGAAEPRPWQPGAD